jgi:hypothetical protein
MLEEVAAEVVRLAIEQSAALTLCRTVPMSSKLRKMPVLSALPIAYFVNGDTGLKQTTEAAWAGLQLEAKRSQRSCRCRKRSLTTLR